MEGVNVGKKNGRLCRLTHVQILPSIVRYLTIFPFLI